MPLYEEKLICPLAVRFTQEHIRPIFQHGHDMEATIRQIKALPGTGDYDVILEAPFPAIEIIRWHQPDKGHAEADAKHWFTLDNRRLYCLQRAAAALWPRVVGVAVEALYRATEGILRKDDSSTVGRSVGIGHSLKALTGRWDWREAVTAKDAEAHARAHKRLGEDDGKASVADLSDAGSGPSTALERLGCFCAAARQDAGAEAAARGEPLGAGSDTSTATPRSRNESDGSDTHAVHFTEHVVGCWLGEKGELYEVRPSGECAWVCWRTDEVAGSKRFTLWYDEAGGVFWWGTNYACFMDAAEFASNPDQAKWYASQDTRMRRPRFAWQKQKATKTADTEWSSAQQQQVQQQDQRQQRQRQRQRPRKQEKEKQKDAAVDAATAATGRRSGAGGSRWVPVQPGC